MAPERRAQHGARVLRVCVCVGMSVLRYVVLFGLMREVYAVWIGWRDAAGVVSRVSSHARTRSNALHAGWLAGVCTDSVF